MAKGKPRAVTPTQGAGAKTPKTGPDEPRRGVQEYPTFSFRYADRAYNGDWGWAEGDDLTQVIDFLCEMSNVTWAEIRNQVTSTKRQTRRRHHEMSFGNVCAEAQRRLQERRLDERFESFFRFRLDGRGRLWGFESNGVFYPLWWDPNHRVYPLDD